MNKAAMIQAMKTSISEILEQMFFLPIDIVEAEEKNIPKDLSGQQTIGASVGFDGPHSGTFLLDIPAELAASITADFLGAVPEDLSMEQINGTVKEMINMLAGNSLSAYNPESPYNLKIPELIAAPVGCGDIEKSEGTIDIGIETLDSRMTLHMTPQQL